MVPSRLLVRQAQVRISPGHGRKLYRRTLSAPERAPMTCRVTRPISELRLSDEKPDWGPISVSGLNTLASAVEETSSG